MSNEISLFLEKMAAENGVCESTLAAYESDITQFLENQNISPLMMTTDRITSFIRFLSQKGYASRTIQRKISALKDFCKFLTEEHILKSNPITDITTPKREKPLPKFLTEDQMKLLCKSAQKHQNKAFQRVFVIIRLLFASGLRVSEMTNLSLQSINHTKRELTVRGKGGKERIVFIDKDTNQIVEEYITTLRDFFIRKGQKSMYLFPSERSAGGHLTRDAFFKDLKKLAVECGISPSLISPHTLRHSFATNLIGHEADLRSVQKILGHAHIATTEIYTHITAPQIIQNVLEKHPLKDMRFKDKE